MLTRRDVLSGTAAALVAPSVATARRRRNAIKPNFVFIMIDDLLSITYNRNRYGVRIIAPNFYRLMESGVYFSNAFASTALCNPSRTSIISGLNPFRTHVHDNHVMWFDHINIQATFPAIMARHGWRCFMYGKIMHGWPDKWTEAGICEEAIGYPHSRFSDKDMDINAVTDAVRRIRTDLRHSAEPWLLMLGLTGPHLPGADAPEVLSRYPLSKIIPIDWAGDPPSSCVGEIYDIVHQEFIDLETAGTVKEYIQGYMADVTQMDRQLGRFMAALETSGLDPIVVLSSDHGFALGDHDVVTKFTLWDEAGRAPLIVRYPHCPAGLTIPQTVSLLDIAPTFLHLAGIKIPERFDGQSLIPFIKDTSLFRTSGAMTTVYDSVSFRSNRYRLSRYSPCDELELYDQKLDPDSTTNLVNDAGYDAVKTEMIRLLDKNLSHWKN